MGLIAIYTGKVVGDACLAHPEVNHWSGLGRLVAGRIGEEYVGASFVLVLILLVGGHVLTGAQALSTISEDITCRIVWAVVSAVVLFLLALPKSFHQISFLGYIDFVSLIAAVLVTIIATGIAAGNRTGGVSSVEWHAFPVDNPSFTQATVQVLNIAFGFSFNIVLPSAMPELVHREHYIRSVVALGAFEIVFYTLVGSLIYVFVGQDVQSPALLSAGPTMARIAFGLALPLIYISGQSRRWNGLRSYADARTSFRLDQWHCDGPLYLPKVSISQLFRTPQLTHLLSSCRIFKPSSPHRYIGTRFGNIIWVLLILGITVLAFVIAEAVPIFSDLLGLISSLFVSGFSFYLPALVWAFAGRAQRTGPWHSWRNLLWGAVNLAIFAIGLFLLGAGTASSVISIRDSYRDGTAKTPFTCSS